MISNYVAVFRISRFPDEGSLDELGGAFQKGLSCGIVFEVLAVEEFAAFLVSDSAVGGLSFLSVCFVDLLSESLDIDEFVLALQPCIVIVFVQIVQFRAGSFATGSWGLGKGFTVGDADVVFLCQFNESSVLPDFFGVDVYISPSDIVYLCVFDHIVKLCKGGPEQFTFSFAFGDQLIGDFALQVVVVLQERFASYCLWFGRQGGVGFSEEALAFLVHDVFAGSLQQVGVAFSFGWVSAVKEEFILSVLFGTFVKDVHFVQSVLQVWELVVHGKGENLRYAFADIGWGVILYVRRWWLIVRSRQR